MPWATHELQRARLSCFCRRFRSITDPARSTMRRSRFSSSLRTARGVSACAGGVTPLLAQRLSSRPHQSRCTCWTHTLACALRRDGCSLCSQPRATLLPFVGTFACTCKARRCCYGGFLPLSCCLTRAWLKCALLAASAWSTSTFPLHRFPAALARVQKRQRVWKVSVAPRTSKAAGCVMGAAVVMMVALGNLTRVQLQRESGVVAL